MKSELTKEILLKMSIQEKDNLIKDIRSLGNELRDHPSLSALLAELVHYEKED